MSNNIAIRWEYERVPGDLSKGSLIVLRDGTALEQVSFDRWPYSKMLSQLSDMLNFYEAKHVVVCRPSKLKVHESKLDSETVEQIRLDPKAAEAAMTFTATVNVRDTASVKPAAVLPTGTATVADSFGESVYVARRGEELECPFCGMWTPLKDRECRNCAHAVLSFSYSAHHPWVCCSTHGLLQIDVPRYYLPRAWNPTSPWISKDALRRMFTTWIDINKEHSQ